MRRVQLVGIMVIDHMININKKRSKKSNQHQLCGQVRKINRFKGRNLLKKKKKICLMSKQLFKKKEIKKMKKLIGFLSEKKKKNTNRIIIHLQKIKIQSQHKSKNQKSQQLDGYRLSWQHPPSLIRMTKGQ